MKYLIALIAPFVFGGCISTGLNMMSSGGMKIVDHRTAPKEGEAKITVLSRESINSPKNSYKPTSATATVVLENIEGSKRIRSSHSSTMYGAVIFDAYFEELGLRAYPVSLEISDTIHGSVISLNQDQINRLVAYAKETPVEVTILLTEDGSGEPEIEIAGISLVAPNSDIIDAILDYLEE